MKILEEYKVRVRNAMMMRVGHEVKVKDAWMHRHENNLENEERYVPELAVDKAHTLDSLLGFLMLQNLAAQQELVGSAPVLCLVVAALEAGGQLTFKKTQGNSKSDLRQQRVLAHFDKEFTAWLEQRRARAFREHGDADAVLKRGPSKQFVAVHDLVATQFPKDYGRQDFDGPKVLSAILHRDNK